MRSLNCKVNRFWLSLALVASSLPICLPGSATNHENPSKRDGAYRFGAIISLHGDLQPWGDECIRGICLAIDEFNASGGLGGKKITLNLEDPNSKVEGGQTAAKWLIQKYAPMVILGDIGSGITSQIEKQAEAARIPVITPCCTRPSLTVGHSNLFRACFTDDYQGMVMAKFAYEDLEFRRVAIVSERNQPYSSSLRDSFRETFTKMGGTITDECYYKTGDTTFLPIIEKLRHDCPDGIFVGGYFNEVGPFVRELRDAGLDVRVMGADGWDSSEILTSSKGAILDDYFCNHFINSDSRPEVQAFVTKWKKHSGSPPSTTVGALGYDAAMLACDALRRAKTKDAAGLASAIENTVGFIGVTGTISLKGKHGNPPKRAIVVKITKEGYRLVKVFEADEKTGNPK